MGALVAFGLGAGLLATTRPTFVGSFHDDAFYYLTIARNLAAGRGFTFDGLHATSGFHPLWLAVLFAVFRLGASDDAALVATHLIELSLVGSAAALAYLTLAPRLGRAAAACAALLPATLPGASAAMRGGMEGAMVLLFLVVAWRAWLPLRDAADPPTRAWLRLGLVCAALTLARLDAAVVVAAVALLDARRLSRRPRAAIALIAPAAVVAVAQLAILRATTGAWLPVNALVKRQLASTFPPALRLAMALDLPWPGERLLALATGGPLWWGPLWARVANDLLLAAIAVAAWRWRRTWIPRVREAGATFPVAAGGAMTAIVIVGVGLLQDWYLPPLLLAIAAAVAAIAAPSARASRAIAIACAAVLALRPAWTWIDDRLVAPVPYTVERLATAAWIAEHARGPVGAWDSGILGYFSRRQVIPLDGLVNDVDFFHDVLVGGRLGEYLRREGVDLLAIPTCASPPVSPHRDYPDLVFVARDPHGCPGDAVFRRDAE
jgi:hypothetical protein